MGARQRHLPVQGHRQRASGITQRAAGNGDWGQVRRHETEAVRCMCVNGFHNHRRHAAVEVQHFTAHDFPQHDGVHAGSAGLPLVRTAEQASSSGCDRLHEHLRHVERAAEVGGRVQGVGAGQAGGVVVRFVHVLDDRRDGGGVRAGVHCRCTGVEKRTDVMEGFGGMGKGWRKKRKKREGGREGSSQPAK